MLVTLASLILAPCAATNSETLSVVLGARYRSPTRRALRSLEDNLRLWKRVDVIIVLESCRTETRAALDSVAWSAGSWQLEMNWLNAVATAAQQGGMLAILTDDDDWTLRAVSSWPLWIEETECGVILPDRERFGRRAPNHAGGLLVRASVLRDIDSEAANRTTNMSLQQLVRSVKHICGAAMLVAVDDFETAKRHAHPRRRLSKHHKRGYFQDSFYAQPLSDVNDIASISLALTLGYEPTASRLEPAVGLNSRSSITRPQALCLLGGLKLAFLGDSVTRFHYYILNEFLATGDVTNLDAGTWGRPGVHYDHYEKWTDLSDASKHRQHFTKVFELGASEAAACPDKAGATIQVQFWFLADWASIEADGTRLFGHVAAWADVVLYNTGVWELMENRGFEAVDPYDAAGLRTRYEGVLRTAFESVVSRVRAGYFRSSSCCGDTGMEPGDISDEERIMQSAMGVWALNEVALRLVSNYNINVIDVWPLITPRTVAPNDGKANVARTTDGIHPVAPLLHVWTNLFLWSVASDDRLYPKNAISGRRDSDAYFLVPALDMRSSPGRASDRASSVVSSADPTVVSSIQTRKASKEHCSNGVQDSNETDVDCGGWKCPPCILGRSCLSDGDCFPGAMCDDRSLCVTARTATPPAPAANVVLLEPPPMPKRANHALHDTFAGDLKENFTFSSPLHDDDDSIGYVAGVGGVGGDHAIRSDAPGLALGPARLEPGWRGAWNDLASLRVLCDAATGVRLVVYTVIFALAALLRLMASLALRRASMRVERMSCNHAFSMIKETPSSSGERTNESIPLRALASAAEVGCWILVAVFCNARAPAGLLPAGTRILAENPDLWWTIMIGLLVGSLFFVKVVHDNETACANFLNRSQTNEWKGWMQIAFVSYHLANAHDVYIPIRWFVSAYVWMTGFGNAQYFCKTHDVSLARFFKMIWRMNLVAAPLSVATGTPWIQYYVVALHTVHFALVFLAYAVVIGISRLLARRRRPESPDSKDSVGWMAVVVLAVFVVGIWEAPYAYDVIIKPVLLHSLGSNFEGYFWYRTRMDYLSSLSGAACAAAFPQLVAGWTRFEARIAESRSRGLVACFASAAAAGETILMLVVAAGCAVIAFWVSAMHRTDHDRYRYIHPYIGTLWVPIYCLARNSTPYLRARVSVPLEWLGARSLELYLLQFHLLMNRSATHLLWLIPNENWPGVNLIVCTLFWLWAATRVFTKTADLRDAAERSLLATFACIAILIAAYAAMASIHVSCSPLAGQPWTLVGIFLAAVSGSVCADCYACLMPLLLARGRVQVSYSRVANMDDSETNQQSHLNTVAVKNDYALEGADKNNVVVAHALSCKFGSRRKGFTRPSAHRRAVRSEEDDADLSSLNDNYRSRVAPNNLDAGYV